MMGLMALLLVLLLLVCGFQGLTIFFSLGLNFLAILLSLIAIAGGINIWLVMVALCGLLLVTTIFMNTKQSLTAKTAFWTSVFVTIGLISIIVPVFYLIASYGFGAEDAEEIEGLTLLIGLSFPEIKVLMVVLSSLGAIAETSIAVASGLVEILEYQPQLTERQVFHAGFEIGEKIIATAFNTLFFSFFGSFLSLTMWFIQLGYPVSKIMNHKILMGEVSALLIGVIGVIATVPLTSWLLNRYRHQNVIKESLKNK